MTRKPQPPSVNDLGVTAIAWAQFLVLSTVISKSDIARMGEAGTYFKQFFFPAWAGLDSGDIFGLDTTPLGGIALLLNAASLGFLSLPMLISSFRSRANARTDLALIKAVTEGPMIPFGVFCWMLSFMAFLIYLSMTIACLTIFAALFGMLWSSHTLRKIEKTKQS